MINFRIEPNYGQSWRDCPFWNVYKNGEYVAHFYSEESAKKFVEIYENLHAQVASRDNEGSQDKA